MKLVIERIVLASLMGQVLAIGGCYRSAVSLRGAMTEYKAERSVQADFAPGSKLLVCDNDGAINVSAGDVTACRVTGTVFVHAPTKREAREIGEQVQVAAEPNDGALVISIKKPTMPRKSRFVSVDLDLSVPRRAHIDCRTQFGRIRLVGIEGDVKATSAFGDITCDDVHGALDLRTQLGRVTCRQIVSDSLVARSQKGSMDISCADACPAEMVADVSTQWGRVRFKAPPHYQGALELESECGSVKLDTPADVRGTMIHSTIMTDKVTGAIGSGQGRLRLFTNLGSVTLK